jgi:hypothetical protein
MDQREFSYFKHFFKHQLPALTGLICEPGVDPLFNIAEQKHWHIPIGDVRRLDSTLRDENVTYQSLKAADYM